MSTVTGYCGKTNKAIKLKQMLYIPGFLSCQKLRKWLTLHCYSFLSIVTSYISLQILLLFAIPAVCVDKSRVVAGSTKEQLVGFPYHLSGHK